MNKKIYLSGIVLGMMTLSMSAMASNTASTPGACDTAQTRSIKEKMRRQAEAECNNPAVNTDNTLTMGDGSENPYVYKNPNEGCDLGFELPGMSGSGSGFNGDSCGILKAVTGDMVNKANQQMQGAVDTALEGIPGGAATIGGIADGTIDINDIEQVGAATVEDEVGTADINDIVLDGIKK